MFTTALIIYSGLGMFCAVSAFLLARECQKLRALITKKDEQINDLREHLAQSEGRNIILRARLRTSEDELQWQTKFADRSIVVKKLIPIKPHQEGA